jgi:hypothetical protein
VNVFDVTRPYELTTVIDTVGHADAATVPVTTPVEALMLELVGKFVPEYVRGYPLKLPLKSSFSVVPDAGSAMVVVSSRQHRSAM